MTINIRPVLTEISVRFSGHGHPHIEISRITLGVKRWHLKNPAPCSYYLSRCYVGIGWRRLHEKKTMYHEGEHVLSRCPGSGWSWPGKLDGVFGMIQRRLVVAGYRSRHPHRCPRLTICNAYWYTVTETGTISTDFMWYFLMSPGSVFTTLISLFLGHKNLLAFQQHKEAFGHGH